MSPEELIVKLVEAFPQAEGNVRVDRGHAVFNVSLNQLEKTIETLKDDSVFDFKMLMDMTVVDWMERKPRFDLVYHLYSVSHNHRLRIKVGIEDGDSAPSLVKFWPISNWLEREMWDTYGVRFSGHPNLKRLLLYDEFKGHPLLKDYPYKKQQPRMPETWPTRPTQFQMKDLKIHRS